jgi:hypothetical protein
MEHVIALERLGLIWPEKESRVERPRPGRGAVAGRAQREATMLESTPEEEVVLIADFMSGQPARQNAFLEKFRPFIRHKARCNFPSLHRVFEDLEQSALVKLCELRADPKEAWRIKPRFIDLAEYLVNAPARILMRSNRHARVSLELKEWDGGRQGNQEDVTYVRELWRLISRLPFKLGRTLQLHAANVCGDGPSLEEILGITRDAARRKLVDAQDALLTLARAEASDE